MIRTKKRGLKQTYAMVVIAFLVSLLIPIILFPRESFEGGGSVSLKHYADVAGGKGFAAVFGRSTFVSCVSAVLTTASTFVLAYTIHYTNVPGGLKKFTCLATVAPMLLPTITYGFAIIYSLGRQRFITGMIGYQMFEIYGFHELFLGYVIYTLPILFILILNTMSFIDKKSMIVSRIMGDSPLKTFLATVIRLLLGTLVVLFAQCFFLCFTDSGIPVSVGGQYGVVATVFYNGMLGSAPDFSRGAVVAMFMLVPSVVGISLLYFPERFNIRYGKVSGIELRKGRIRDIRCGAVFVLILASVLCIFAAIFVMPMVEKWSYRRQSTTEHVKTMFTGSRLLSVYKNSILVLILTALTGSLVAYAAALVMVRGRLSSRLRSVIENIVLVTNTIPDMVIGIALLLTLSGTPTQNTFFIIVICNVMYFFSTPYLMMKSSLAKMNASWEITALLVGDNRLKTTVRVVAPNTVSTLLKVLGYYFVNIIATVSAAILIAGARTMAITTKIRELQYHTEFNEIFVLSLLILIMNLVTKGLFEYLAGGRCKNRRRKTIMKNWKKAVAMGRLAAVLAAAVAVTGCQKKEVQVITHSSADDGAVEAMEYALNGNGYGGKYLFQIFGTSELGDKLSAEGADIEADLVTISSFYLEGAQEQNHMFLDLTLDTEPLEKYPAYHSPATRQEGAIILNTKMMKEHQLPTPSSIRDPVNPAYADLISVTDIKSSSIAWLLTQAIVSGCGEDGTKEVLSEIYQNAGLHIESSGSTPLKKVRAGKAAVGFGLRHQAVADKAEGFLVDYVSPTEGNFSLTESAAATDKGDKTNKLAMEAAECITKNDRQELLTTYPLPIYEGETSSSKNQSAYPRVFPEKLTVDLLKKHQELSESCKQGKNLSAKRLLREAAGNKAKH